MKEHEHNCTSNTSECFKTFIGCKVKGLLKNALPLGRADLARGTRTIVFDCGWGLTISSNGSYWTESPDEIKRAVSIHLKRLQETEVETKSILELAGQ